IGTGKFLWKNSPAGFASNRIQEGIQMMKAGPAAAQANAQAQLHAAGTVVAAVSGNPVAQAQIATNAVNAWNGMSTTDKASVVTETTLNFAGIVASGKIPAPSGLANDALVVRGGVPTAGQLTKGAEGIAADGTLNGISVNSANGATVEQLS